LIIGVDDVVRRNPRLAIDDHMHPVHDLDDRIGVSLPEIPRAAVGNP
jgi:hypothetical protein